ncbi:type II toxin-antitoxin system RelE/ParE family toxin [Pasteurella skyensis]|uniref:Type II toxin-antitoxin system RelE/ParE family toxin n=1 Tax=Phocoenobacter skyensis TaxID=97481 RepID=A0AAJ6NEC3_9PAST|nr:type II toxin-antitoxin system RelE/ParE family toxin [Pasteurella skyensis]MDP8171150.1 type II toxin-antitoxin system RelE/ParE family toxin [Pasteurella skyensis]MDP8175235.1 type II toxin-antitoxin system RelE/ParE family toxin [Pasteurella skyensis]
MNIILTSERFDKWLSKLKDKLAVAIIMRRLDRLRLGNFGDHKSVGQGVYELRVDTGKGYRIYYAREGDVTYLLISGGNKKSQQKDIDEAIKLWTEYKQGNKK